MANGTYAFTGSIQFVTIRTNGVYDITAYGAQGGRAVHGSGGTGTEIEGSLYLAAGTILEIVVGGAGANGYTRSGAGGGSGGGGSFVLESTDGGASYHLLLAAGGGGGGYTGGNGGSGAGGGGGTSIDRGIALVAQSREFLNESSGTLPVGGLFADAAGNLFGTTRSGGANNLGTVFEIAKTTSGYATTPTVLVNFDGSNGASPLGSLVADTAGNLFGTAQASVNGPNSGTVFEIAKTATGYATPTVLASFNHTNGANPGFGGLIFDAAGNLFGTAETGGANDLGTVFEITKTASGYDSTPTVLVSFDSTNGSIPYAGLIADAAGNLFGTTLEGGANNLGTVFEIKKTATGYDSTPTVLVSFDGTNGSAPYAGLIADAAGNLFGTTETGGANGNGTVFEITGSGFVVAACYCCGTLIRTVRGEVPVEHLKVGDRVVTISGDAKPIKWIGRRSYSGRFALGQKHIMPICFKAGSIADNVPRRDLWISPHHAMYLDGMLIEAKDLVNGVSVVQAEKVVDKIEYFHIELDSHDVIVAEGAFSETYIDDDNRAMFHNAHEYWASHPDAPREPARYCAPRRDEGYEVEAARQTIDTRAGLRSATDQKKLTLRGCVDDVSSHCIAGWAQTVEYPEAPVCFDIYAGGRLIGQVLANRYRKDLQDADLGSGCHSFVFTPPAGLCFASHAVEVRRSLDAAILPLSDRCQIAIARCDFAA